MNNAIEERHAKFRVFSSGEPFLINIFSVTEDVDP